MSRIMHGIIYIQRKIVEACDRHIEGQYGIQLNNHRQRIAFNRAHTAKSAIKGPEITNLKLFKQQN